MTNLERLKADVETWNKKRDKAEKEQASALAELRALGVDPDNVSEEIAKLTKTIQEEETKFEQEAKRLSEEIKAKLAEWDA